MNTSGHPPANPLLPPLPIAVLAGGSSSRMGRDKASLEIDGTTLLRRTVGIAREYTPDIAVVGRARPDDWDAHTPVTYLPDDAPGAGPLGGIATALRWALSIGREAVVVIACDLPLLSSPALAWLLETAEESRPFVDGIAAVGAEDRIEPLFSVYGIACQDQISARIASGRRSPTRMILEGRFGVVDAPQFVVRALANANTPEEWRALRPE